MVGVSGQTSEYEAASRLRKARKLAVVLDEVLDADPALTIEDLATRATEETRRLTAAAAGTRVPSEETWRWTIEVLRERRVPPSTSRAG